MKGEIQMVNLETISTDELFTELMKRIRKESKSSCYFIDSTTVKPFPRWCLYGLKNDEPRIFAKEVKRWVSE